MTMKRATWWVGGLTLAAVVLSAAPGVQADPTLDFAMNSPTGGTISYSTVGGPLTGSGIQVDNVTGGLGTAGTNTPANTGVVALCVSCTLSFTTGNLVSATGNQWTFGSGGSITLTGGINFPDATPDIATGTTLFTGSWSTVVVTDLGFINNKLQGGVFSDIKNADLAAFFGLEGGPGHDWAGAFNLGFFAIGSVPGTFTSFATTSGDITNTPQPVPEPATLMLLGTALVGAGAWNRRRQTRKDMARSAA